MYKELYITDGTTKINLLHLADGYSSSGQRQQIAQYKGGGTWSQSALGDGGQLVYYAYDDAIETYPLDVVSTTSPKATAAALWDLLGLLRKCADYWALEYKGEPVWIIMQANGEPGRRHAVIKSGSIPDIGATLNEPFDTLSTVAALQLIIRRGHWQDQAPGEDTALPISSTMTFGGRTWGNVDAAQALDPTTDDELFINNCAIETNLTHQYFMSFVGAWTGNLIGAGAMNLLGAFATETMYYGIEDTGAAQRVPFNNLIFDVTQAQTGIDTVWENWTGAAWATINTIDSTDLSIGNNRAFQQLGVNSVVFINSVGWVSCNLQTVLGGAAPNILAYWVRCRTTALPGPLVMATQSARQIYIATWTSLEVQPGVIAGQIPALCNASFVNRSETNAAAGYATARVIGGVRSTSRGTGFRANINLGGQQNPASATATPTAAGTSVIWPPYYTASYTPAGAAAASQEASVSLAGTDWFGRFRVFVRYYQSTGAAGDVSAYISHQHAAVAGGFIKQSKTLPSVVGAGGYALWDFGEFTLPGVLPMSLTATNVFYIYLANSNAAGVALTMYDLVLIPTDEYTFDVSELDNLMAISYPEFVFLDSTGNTKRIMQTRGISPLVPDTLKSVWLTVAGDSLQLEPGEKQRIWFLTSDYSTAEHSQANLVNSVQMRSVNRYLSLREV